MVVFVRLSEAYTFFELLFLNRVINNTTYQSLLETIGVCLLEDRVGCGEHWSGS